MSTKTSVYYVNRLSKVTQLIPEQTATDKQKQLPKCIKYVHQLTYIGNGLLRQPAVMWAAETNGQVMLYLTKGFPNVVEIAHAFAAYQINHTTRQLSVDFEVDTNISYRTRIPNFDTVVNALLDRCPSVAKVGQQPSTLSNQQIGVVVVATFALLFSAFRHLIVMTSRLPIARIVPIGVCLLCSVTKLFTSQPTYALIGRPLALMGETVGMWGSVLFLVGWLTYIVYKFICAITARV
jgi:hypothetical protein